MDGRTDGCRPAGRRRASERLCLTDASNETRDSVRTSVLLLRAKAAYEARQKKGKGTDTKDWREAS
jgi:hypothetical protein